MMVELISDKGNGTIIMSITVEAELQKIAIDLAHEEWDRHHGFGLYHASEAVQAGEIKKARKTVDAWFSRLTPAFQSSITN